MTHRSNGKARHGNRLLPSTPDDVALGQAVEEKFIELCSAYFRIRHVELVPPQSLDADMLRWRTMRVRHKCKRCQSGDVLILLSWMGCKRCGGKGDYRHTDAEKRSTRTIANWTLEVNAELRNQKKATIEWPD